MNSKNEMARNMVNKIHIPIIGLDKQNFWA